MKGVFASLLCLWLKYLLKCQFVEFYYLFSGAWSDVNKYVPKMSHMDDLPPLLVERDVNGEWMVFLFSIIFDINQHDFQKALDILHFLYIQSRINILGRILVTDLETEDLLEGNINFINMIRYYAKGISYITSLYLIFFICSWENLDNLKYNVSPREIFY